MTYADMRLERAAAALDADISTRPDSTPPRFHEDGDPAAGQPIVAPHPLTRFIQIGDTPMAPSWIVPGVIARGVVTFAGSPGIGKTSVILPLALIVAGLHAPDDPLAPRHWRHIVLITEDYEQAHRILMGVVLGAGIGITMEMVRERVHIVPAKRMPAAYVVQAGGEYARQFTRIADGIKVPPLVIFDTLPAIFDIEGENDNSEASKLIACLKQDFAELPAWVVGHVAKDKVGRADVESMSLRGGSAYEGDAHQTVVFFKEQDGTRYLALKKCRFEPRWQELRIDSAAIETEASNEYGETECVTLRWGTPRPPELTRAQLREEARRDDERARETELRGKVLDAVDSAWKNGQPYNKTQLRGALGGRAVDVGHVIGKLLAEGWLYDVSIPAALRANNNAKSFLIRLSDDERRALLADGALPAAKAEVPPLLRKPGTDGNRREPTKAALLAAAMRACDHWGDSPAARQAMRDQLAEAPRHLHAELLQHFERNYPQGGTP